MSVLASLITAVWELFKKTKKGKKNPCSKILDDNKSVEQFKDKTPLLKVDYTERRWEKVLASTPQAKGHCCNENCRCQLVKEYTKALNEGDTKKVEEIIRGEYDPHKFDLEVYDEEPKVKMCQRDINRLRHSMNKIERELKDKNRNTSDGSNLRRCNSERVRSRRSSTDKYSSSVRSKPRKMKCCSNENCGCHIVQEFTRAQIEGNEELMDKIRKGMHFNRDFVASNQATRKSDIEKDTIDITLDNKDTNGHPLQCSISDIKPIETLVQSDKNDLKLEEIRVTRSTSHDANLHVDNRMTNYDPCRLSRKSSCPTYNTTYASETFKSFLPDIPVKHRRTSCPTYTTFSVNNHEPETSKNQVPKEVEHEDLDNSFRHTIPHYYAENENALNHMKHKKKVKKRQKKSSDLPKTKTVNVSRDQFGILPTLKGKIKRYNSLVEEESDSSWTDGAENIDGFTTS